ncbi:MAG: alpha/beta hydrolase [Polaromonas sp.]|nr:alpha/beta hydrolase [Polaromonas sp.]
MTTWIFLRGLTRERRHWGEFVGQFQQALPHQSVVTLDLAGNGRLNHLRSASLVQDMVADCRLQLALRHIAPPYHLLAMSLGAMVAAAWAQSHPDEVEAQVLINTSLRPFSPFYQRLRPANYAALLRLLLPGATPRDRERAILRMTSRGGHEAVLPSWLALRDTHPVSRLNALRQLLAAVRYAAPAHPPRTPTLLLASAQDQLVSVQCTLALARQWGCDHHIHPTAGHDLPLDDGPWVADQVREWLLSSRLRGTTP